MPLMTFPSHHSFSHLIFPPNVYPSTLVGDWISDLVSSNIKSLQYLLRSLRSLGVFSLSRLRCSRHSTLFAHTSTGFIEARLLRAATVVLNHRTSFYLMLDCLAHDSLRLAIFDHSLTILALWSDRALISRNGSGQLTTTTTAKPQRPNLA